MAIIVGLNDALKRWSLLTSQIQSMSTVNTAEDLAEKFERIANVRNNYAAFVEYYFPHYCTNKETGHIIPSAKFHVKAANQIRKQPNCKAVFKWARGHAKSTHMDIFIPLWLKCQEPRQINTMVLVGKSEESAVKLLGDIQAELQYNKRYIHDFGRQYNSGKWSEGAFTTADGCYFTALGRGQSPRGLRERANRPDYIVVDDLDDDEICQNESRIRKLTDWVKEALFGCFGAQGGKFIMVGNLIAKNSVLANICDIKNVDVSQVNIVDKNGNPSWPEMWTPERINEVETFQGYRSFQKEYMNNPITEGAVFRHDWIKWKPILKFTKYDNIIAYCDPSFKSSSKNDYKAIKVWGKTGNELHCIEAFVRQCSVSEMVRWFYDLHEQFEKQQAICNYYIEANFLQDIILDEFTSEGNVRGYQLPIRADIRKKPDKFQRIEAVSPLWERGFVFYNEAKKGDRDMTVALDQTLAFEKGTRAHDDAPDADEGAIYLLQRSSRAAVYQPKFGMREPSKYTW